MLKKAAASLLSPGARKRIFVAANLYRKHTRKVILGHVVEASQVDT